MSQSRVILKLVALALVCYGVYYRWSPGDDDVIRLTPRRIAEIADRYEELLGRPLSDAERVESTKNFIEEEILVREAFRRGLDRGDRRVRPMLIEHASRVLLQAAQYQHSTPPEGELRSYFERHAARYRIPERVDLQQVLFPAGSTPAKIDSVLAELRAGADFTMMGAAGLGADVKEVSRSQIAQAFGLDLAHDVFALGDGGWHGPFTSSSGTHFFRIQRRSPARDPRFEDVQDDVAQDYASDIEHEIVDAQLERIRKRYRVVIDDAG